MWGAPAVCFVFDNKLFGACLLLLQQTAANEPPATGGVGGGSGSTSGNATTSTAALKNQGPSPDTLEALISVNHKLGLDMAALGILRQAEQRAEAGLYGLVVRPSWLEKLSRYMILNYFTMPSFFQL